MVKLVHGGDIYSARERIEGEIIDFSANINPLGLPDSVKKALIESMDAFSCYPDPLCRELVCKIAELEQVSKENVLCANGAADLIFRISWAMRPRNALIAVPTFAEYEQALSSVGCHVNYFSLKKENDFLLTEDFLNEIQPNTDIVFLCNPNNPTGQLIEPNLLERILVRCSSCGTLLVVDECFRDFLDEPQKNSMNSWISTFPNLLILRAFTKHYAMAGLRLGYCLCKNTPLLERMVQCGQPWGVSVPAQVAGLAALKDHDYLEQSRVLLREEKKYLLSSLQKLDIRPIGSQANYIFFQLTDSDDVSSFLEEKGILIRSCANYPGLSNEYYRIAIKSHADNEKLIAALTEFLQPPIIEPLVQETHTITIEEQNPNSEEMPSASKNELVEEPKKSENPNENDTQEIVEETIPNIPNHDLSSPHSAEQKKQYRFLREKSKKYDWEEEEN